MNSLSDQLVIDSLDGLEKGRSVESLLKVDPAEAEMLRPILETAESLAAVKVAHSLEAQASSRRLFLQEAAAMQASGRAGRRTPLILWRRLAFSAGFLAVLVFLFAAAMIFTSQSAIPGDALYNTKRTIEELRLSLARDTVMFESLSSRFEDERIAEIEGLLSSDRNVDGLEFAGEIFEMDEDRWIVADLSLQITENTTIIGKPQIGQHVQVIASLKDGMLFADEITSLFTPEVTPNPELNITPSSMVEEETAPASVPEPAIVTTPSRLPDELGELTRTPTATSTPTHVQDPAIEATASPGDDAGDNGEADDNGGPGGDDDAIESEDEPGESEDEPGESEDEPSEGEDESEESKDEHDESEEDSGESEDDSDESEDESDESEDEPNENDNSGPGSGEDSISNGGSGG